MGREAVLDGEGSALGGVGDGVGGVVAALDGQ